MVTISAFMGNNFTTARVVDEMSKGKSSHGPTYLRLSAARRVVDEMSNGK